VKTIGEEMGIGFLGLGFQPKWALSDTPIMPKVWMNYYVGEGIY
jgi:glutamate--cysteine ligase